MSSKCREHCSLSPETLRKSEEFKCHRVAIQWQIREEDAACSELLLGPPATPMTPWAIPSATEQSLALSLLLYTLEKQWNMRLLDRLCRSSLDHKSEFRCLAG